MVNKANQQFITEELGLPSPSLKLQTKAQTQKMFDKIVETAGGKETQVEAPNLMAWIERNLDELPFKDKDLFKRLASIRQDLIQTGRTSFGKLNGVSSTVWAKYSKLDPAMRRMHGQVKGAVIEDLRHIQETTGRPVADAFQRAMEAARMGHRIREAEFIEGLIRRSTRYDINKGVGIFQPAKFKAEVERAMPRLEVMFNKNPEIPKMIQKYADQMMLAARDLAEYAATKPTGLLEKMALGGGGIVGLKTGVLFDPKLWVPMGFETWMAHSLAHPRGWLKSFLFRSGPGVIPQLGKEVTKMGLMAKPPILGPRREFEEEYLFPLP